jgi:beta-lactamase class A
MPFKIRNVFYVVLVILVSGCLGLESIQGQAPPQGAERLKLQLENAVRGVEGIVGVAAKHLETGEEVLLNGDVKFPMASVFKLPVFVELMAQIGDGKYALDDMIKIEIPDQHLGSGMLSSLDVPGIMLSIRNLVNMMMMISDNSATDIIVNKVGPENVNARMRSYGIAGISVDRTCQELIMDWLGLDYDKYKGLGLEEVMNAISKDTRGNSEAAAKAKEIFSSDERDQATPAAMNRLLELIFTKKILDDKSCEYIIDVLLKCQTGARRIKGDLPRGSKVAHKTGTIGGTVNNAGIIFLPNDLGHVVLTVFSKDTTLETDEVEDIIAQIARFVYDYFYFTADLSQFK